VKRIPPDDLKVGSRFIQPDGRGAGETREVTALTEVDGYTEVVSVAVIGEDTRPLTEMFAPWDELALVSE